VQAGLFDVHVVAVTLELVGHEGGADAVQAVEQRGALGPVGQALDALKQRVGLGVLEAADVVATGVAAGQARGGRAAVDQRRGVGHRPHLQLAAARALELLGPLGDLEGDAQADALHVLVEQLVDLALVALGGGGHGQTQRRAAGRLAAAVGVDVAVAVGVEQGLGLGGVELAHGAGQPGAVGAGVRRVVALGLDGGTAPHDADLARHVHGQADGAAQRHLFGRQAADHRVLEIEEQQEDVGAQRAVQAHAALGEVGRQPAAGRGDLREGLGHALDEVLLAAQEAQPARLVLGEDADLDAVQHGDAPALEARGQGQALGVVGGGLGVVEAFTVAGVSLQHDEAAAPPLPEHEGAGADRVRREVLAIGLDDLARHRAEQVGQRDLLQEMRQRLLQLDAQGVTVQHLQAAQRRVVVEGPLAGLGALARRLQSDDLPALHRAPGRAGVLRVGETLPGVGEVGRGELAFLTLEGRVVLEVNAGLDARRPDLEVLARRRAARWW
jgi:hypothetical protein